MKKIPPRHEPKKGVKQYDVIYLEWPAGKLSRTRLTKHSIHAFAKLHLLEKGEYLVMDNGKIVKDIGDQLPDAFKPKPTKSRARRWYQPQYYRRTK